VIGLPADPTFPDGVFVEDTAVILDEVAVLISPAPQTRRGESTAVRAAISPYRQSLQPPANAFLEGGDVLRVGRTLFVGLSSRTSESGVGARADIVTLGFLGVVHGGPFMFVS
jgi:dimethylargininase